MHYYIYHLPGPIWWRVRDDTPAVFPDATLGQQVVVNPCALGQFQRHLSDRSVGTRFRYEDSTLLETRCLVLGSDSSAQRAPKEAVAEVSEVERLLRRLRFVSRQATLPAEANARLGPIALSEPLALEPMPPLPTEASIRRHLAEWAVTESHVHVATSALASTLPTHDELLLDSQAAGLRGDDRSAILFAAIACEILAGSAADAAQSARTFGLSDPVFVHLRERARFAQLMHVVSLYCRGTSLLQDNPSLYHRALKLYRTRNRIAHEGLPPLDESYLALDREGAKEAIDVALGVFAWYGEGAGYVNPLSLSFLRLS